MFTQHGDNLHSVFQNHEIISYRKIISKLVFKMINLRNPINGSLIQEII